MENNQVATTAKPQMQIMKVLQETPVKQIGDLEFVKEKFISNYNFCNPGNLGELMYHRQVVHFKQAIAASEALQKADPFSIYACLITVSVKNWSLDPIDQEVYMFTRGGKAVLQPQAGSYVKRLMQSGQIIFADQVKLVYKGDIEVENGRVVKHIERFESEEIVLGYVKFVIDQRGNDRYFIYRKSDWEAWKKKSPQANGDNWSGNNGQPGAAFLRTKIVLHACKEKCWAVGNVDPRAEMYNDIIVDDEEAPSLPPSTGASPAAMSVTSTGQLDTSDDESFAENNQPAGNTTSFTDDDF